MILKEEKLSEENDFLLRCCLALFQIYLEYLNNPEEKIKTIWNNKLKNIICKKYCIQKGGKVNENSDVEFLIQEIERILNKNNNNQQSNLDKKSEPLNNNKLNKIRMNTIYVSSQQFMNKGNNKNEQNNNNKTILNKPKTKNPKNKTLCENNNQKIKEMKNEIIINPPQNKKMESFTVKIKKNEKINIQSLIITIRQKFNITLKKRKNKSSDDKLLRKISLSKAFDIEQYAHEVYIKDNDDINNIKKKTILDKKSTKKKTMISSNYNDEINSDKTIRYKNKKLKAISLNFLLKQIVSTDFIEKEENIEFIYGFCQQCYSFVKKENLFQKVLNCYNYYKKLNTPFIQMKKLIYFINLLSIEMFEFYNNTKFPMDKNLQKFYKCLETDMLSIINNNKKPIEIKDIKETPKVKDSKVKRASCEFMEKIKKLEELNYRRDSLKSNKSNKDNKNIIENQKKEKDKKDIKKKDNEEIEALNEILNITTLFDSKTHNNYFILIIKNNMKLYQSYLKRKSKDKNNKNKFICKKDTSKIQEIKLKSRANCDYFSVLNYDPSEIGEALINISKEILYKIEKRELYCAIFLKKVKEKKFPNITKCIEKFNRLTSFIVEDILSYDFPKVRAKIIYYWLKVADYLKQKKDHNDCFAIYTALHHYTIKGLELTNKEMKSKYKILYNKIKQYCSFEDNYKNFREEINNCVKNNEYYLPYLGLLMRDIAFYEANYDYIMDNNELINVEKIEKIQEIIDDFFYFKNINNDENNNTNNRSDNINYPQELNFFNNLENIKEDDLEILANKLEPKFILSDLPHKSKRLTNIDKKYFFIRHSAFLPNNNIIHKEKERLEYESFVVV